MLINSRRVDSRVEPHSYLNGVLMQQSFQLLDTPFIAHCVDYPID